MFGYKLIKESELEVLRKAKSQLQLSAEIIAEYNESMLAKQLSHLAEYEQCLLRKYKRVCEKMNELEEENARLRNYYKRRC